MWYWRKKGLLRKSAFASFGVEAANFFFFFFLIGWIVGWSIAVVGNVVLEDLLRFCE